MKKLLIFCFVTLTKLAYSQDTFSIVAVDSITGEVGSAGASCIDATQIAGGCSILSDVHPGVGVVHTQASYHPTNQNYARSLMNLGLLPAQIIDSVKKYDIANDSTVRQYGIAGLYGGSPRVKAFTGANCFNYKNHIEGPYYSIQGNILLGQLVLDSMEARFLREPGDLACKLMAAMQGAKMIGADTRCTLSGNSSLSSFLRVAKPTDLISNLYINIVVAQGPTGFEPIDSLQQRFNLIHNCILVGVSENKKENIIVEVYPNPFTSSAIIKLKSTSLIKYVLELHNQSGQIVNKMQIANAANEAVIHKGNLSPGLYYYKIITENKAVITGKLLVQ